MVKEGVREGAERRAKENILIIGYSHVTKNQKFIILTQYAYNNYVVGTQS